MTHTDCNFPEFISADAAELRKTRHTHNPVDDAKGNAEAFLTLVDEFKLKIRL